MKTKSTILLLLLTVISVYSQQLYFGVQAGANMGVAKQRVNTYFYYTNEVPFLNFAEGENGETYLENVPVSFASGLGISAHIGYMQGNYGIEISSAFVRGLSQVATTQYRGSEATYEVMSRNMSFKPVLVYKTDTTKLAFLCKLGAIVSTSSITNHMYSEDNNITNSTKEMESVQTGKWQVGGYMAIGVEYRVVKGLLFKALIDFTMVSFKPTQSKLTKYEINGDDQMMLISEKNQIITFSDKVKTNNNSQNEQLAPQYNLTSIGFNLGVYYIISFKK